MIRRGDVLRIRRTAPRGRRNGCSPGGRPRPGEGMFLCVRREVVEETGVVVTLDRCAFVADVIDPDGARCRAELVFEARVSGDQPVTLSGERGAEPCWVSLGDLRGVRLRPPVGGLLPSLVKGMAGTATYLGNLRRPDVVAGQ
ncbi:MAG: NUDIX domain-containing protein [Nocardioides sp.]